ncbi:superoxide dismutase family protein [Paenibacillus sp. GD4]|uniref:superoxide dismutase family protein n=1 Tax=Paenibacillus sp. GD4 TaxID=3068890 RepID=UPI00279640F5|nr:superoxide dismutase family protein [Paenibacillus sp. GD4]MDQ1909162.1 superoxide dismutase family protein [Paenibacillus sp. GD4]
MKGWLWKAGLCAALLAGVGGCFGNSTYKNAPGAEMDHSNHIQTNTTTKDQSVPTMSEASTGSIMVNMMNAKGQVIGKAELTETAAGVKVKVEASSLTPGKHGLHFHQVGKCEPPEFKTAGDHFNPAGKKHGTENPAGPHAGDLPNLEVGADGKAALEFTTTLVTLAKGKPNSLLKEGGTSLVIHEKEDDYKTDPSGNSGARIACGVIQ